MMVLYIKITNGVIMKKPVLLLLTALILSSSVSTSKAEASLNLNIMPRGAHVDVNKLIEQMPVKDMSELPPHGLTLKHQGAHPFGVIYHGVRYVEGHDKKIAHEHHAQNKLIWFKGLVDHVRMTSMHYSHHDSHKPYPILKVTVDRLKEKLDDMVAKAPPEARAKMHEEGWKMIHDLVNELRPQVVDHRQVHLDGELAKLVKSSADMDQETSVERKAEMTKDLKKKGCELHNKGIALSHINKAVTVDASECATVAPRNAVIAASAKVTQ